jgi:endonuclease/exonuclease/phosphatase (EEP) superfamily protein YafD
MDIWHIVLNTLSIICALVSFLPFLDFKHWFFRVFDFIRLQLLALLVALFIAGLFFSGAPIFLETLTRVLLLIAITYQFFVIWPYIPFRKKSGKLPKEAITLISVNVLQKNTDHQKLIGLVKQIQPDILLTMESNLEWEKALSELENDFAFSHKIPKENRYGMHFYSKLKVKSCQGHYLISEEHPSIEATLVDKNGTDFIFWGIHPPPPSPTEKPTSKQKDAELMKVAQLVRKKKTPTLVSGDFNNVCWSKSSRLFSKVSKLKDARLGKGFYSTFPVKPKLFRFPIDLLFHSKDMEVHQIKTLPAIGSDHLPLFATFTITDVGHNTIKPMEPEVKQEVVSIIVEGKEAAQEEN